MSEKDFCTLLTEQIIDERNATKAYRRLLDLFEEEKDLLLADKDPYDKKYHVTAFQTIIKEISEEQSTHAEWLEGRRKLFCEVKEE